MGQVNGHFARDGSRTDSPAGRLIAGAQLAATRSAQTGAAQMAFMNLSGARVRALLESQQKPAATEPSFLQPSEGVTYTWQADAPAGERVRDLRLNSEPLLLAQAYRVTVNSFLAEGGDGFVLLKEGAARLGGGQDIDALVAYLRASPPREPSAQARINRGP